MPRIKCRALCPQLALNRDYTHGSSFLTFLVGGRQAGSYDSPSANFRLARHPGQIAGIGVILYYQGALTPFLSISMAFPNLFNRVSSFLASVIQRQYSLRWV